MSIFNTNINIDNHKLSNSQQVGEKIQEDRAIMGQELPLGGFVGENSFPGSDITYTPPEEVPNLVTEMILKSHMEESTPMNNDKKQNTKTNKNNKNNKNTKNNKNNKNNKNKIISKAKKKYQYLRAFVANKLLKDNELHLDENENRAILGEKLALGEYPMGMNSFPGPDITYTSPVASSCIVNLGCLNSSFVTDIVQITQTWPKNKTPYEFASNSIINHTNNNSLDVNSIPLEQNSPIFNNAVITNSLGNGTSTPFNSSVYLTSNVSFYASASGIVPSTYASVNLSEEGLLWTLWSLTKADFSEHPTITYFDEIYFGTAKKSKYPLGQLGYFINNKIMGCTPLGAVNPNSGNNVSNVSSYNYQASNYTLGILPGIESLNQALHTITGPQLAITVVKVTEQIARIENPESGMAADDEFIFVGYDGWAVINTTANPMGPLMFNTYITPQSVTGSVVGDNYQVILPPNFPSVLFYKNDGYAIPVDTSVGLFMGTPYASQ